MNLPEPHLTEQNQSPPKKRGWLVWLKNTEAWKRLITRASGRFFVLYLLLLGGVLSWADTLIELHTPVLKQAELTPRIGVLQGAGYSGKPRNSRWAILRESNGELVHYRGGAGSVEPLQKLIGKTVVAYSQKKFCFICLGYEEVLLEVKYEDKAQLYYDYEKRLWIHQNWWSLGGAWFISGIETLLIVLLLIVLWHAGKLPTPLLQMDLTPPAK